MRINWLSPVPPTEDELRDGAAYLAGIEQEFASASVPAEKLERAAWASYCRVIYSANEFIYLD